MGVLCDASAIIQDICMAIFLKSYLPVNSSSYG